MTNHSYPEGFDFLEYGGNLEALMQSWASHTGSALDQSSDLGFAREHFVKNVLTSFMPNSIVIGSGEIIDREGKRSGQQDVIIYRGDFPVITSLTPVNTYLAEGVIATVEVKSNLSAGKPNGLRVACRNVQRVRALHKAAAIISSEGPDHERRLQEANSIRTYVVGYSGWKTHESLGRNLGEAAYETGYQSLPHAVYQPGYLIIPNDGFLANQPRPPDKYPFLLHSEHPFSMLLLHLLKAVLQGLGGLTVRHPRISATMEYDLGPYFDFCQQPFRGLVLVPVARESQP